MGMQLGTEDPNLNFMLGDEQVDAIYLGTAYVWPNESIYDFQASDNRVKEIKINFTDPNIVKADSYDLYESDILMVNGVVNGEVFTAEVGTAPFFVRARYASGHGINSNVDDGTSLAGLPPGPITDFQASDDQIFQVQCWWTNATGDPAPAYDLYENGGIVAQNVFSGHAQAAAEGTRPWHVVARNASGSKASNTDNGTALGEAPPPTGGFVDFATPGVYSWTPPSGVSQVFVTVIGGGGSGSTTTNDSGGQQPAGGGYSGVAIKQQPVTVGNQAYTITVGAGGAKVQQGDNRHGNDGTSSDALGVFALLGGGGNADQPAYPGEGSGMDGTRMDGQYGGQGNYLGRGGNGGSNAAGGIGNPGGVGAGGGAGYTEGSTDGVGGAGGNGFVRIEW